MSNWQANSIMANQVFADLMATLMCVGNCAQAWIARALAATCAMSRKLVEWMSAFPAGGGTSTPSFTSAGRPAHRAVLANRRGGGS
jgi:hypothetical protein